MAPYQPKPDAVLLAAPGSNVVKENYLHHLFLSMEVYCSHGEL
jgi:hypothetical protein